MQNIDSSGRDRNSWPWNVWQVPDSGLTWRDLENLTLTNAEFLAMKVVTNLMRRDRAADGSTVLVPPRQNGHGVLLHHQNLGGFADDGAAASATTLDKRAWGSLLAAGYTVVGNTMSSTAQYGDPDYMTKADQMLAFGQNYVRGKWVHVAISKGAVGGLLMTAVAGPTANPAFGEGIYVCDGCTSLAHTYLTNPLGSTAQIDACYNIPGGGTYAAQTAGRDPHLRAASDWTGKRVRLSYSSGDTLTPAADHALLFAAQHATGAKEMSTFRSATAEHGVVTNLDTADLLSFVGRCVS